MQDQGQLRAYLWGIETMPKEKQLVEIDNCEPTYEELKHIKTAHNLTAT